MGIDLLLRTRGCIRLQPCGIAPASKNRARAKLLPTSRSLFLQTGSSSDMPYCHFPSHDIPGSARPAKKSPDWQWCSRPHATAVAGFKLSVLYSEDGSKQPPYVRHLHVYVFVIVCSGTIHQPSRWRWSAMLRLKNSLFSKTCRSPRAPMKSRDCDRPKR